VSDPLDSAEIFDPTSNTFRSIGPMHGPRAWPLVARLSDGSVLIAGGRDSAGLLATAELFQ
jgi:Kelch motif protein